MKAAPDSTAEASSRPRTSVCIITRNRTDELFETLENLSQQTEPDMQWIVLDNGSDPDVADRHRERFAAEYPQVLFHETGENLGVAGGRNVALGLATGRWIVELDDDAVFLEPDAIATATSFLEANPDVGIVASRIINYHTRRMTGYEYPFRDKRRDPMQPGDTGWFIGAAHVFQRRLLDEVGVYREFFPWGSEELDLSLRALAAGFRIHYLPSLAVYHKKSPKARITDPVEFTGVAIKNRVKAASLNLPWHAAATCMLVRSVQKIVQFRTLAGPWRACRLLWAERAYIREHRRVLPRDVRRRLRQFTGPVFY